MPNGGYAGVEFGYPDLIFDNKIYKSFLDNMPTKEAAKIISMITKENKRDIYKKLLELK